MAEVIWTKKAFGQLERNINFVRNEQGLKTAITIQTKILRTTALLSGQPKMGKIEPLLKHRKSEYRFLIVWSYKIIYRVVRDMVIISRLFHTSRNPNSLKGI